MSSVGFSPQPALHLFRWLLALRRGRTGNGNSGYIIHMLRGFAMRSIPKEGARVELQSFANLATPPSKKQLNSISFFCLGSSLTLL